MYIPQSFNIYNYNIASIFIVLVISVIFSLFVYWYEIRRDGFDEEEAIDLFIICVFSGVLLSRFTYGVIETFPPNSLLIHILKFWTSGFNAMGLVVGLLFPIILFTQSWKWSLYRIADIFVLSLSVGSVPLLFGLFLINGDYIYLISSLVYVVLFFILYKLRLKMKSGLISSLFLLVNVFFGVIIVHTKEYLIFYVGLITISIINLVLREKRNPMKSNLSATFLNKVKSLLSAKDKKLQAEQKLLLEEDPYMMDGRDSDNEYLDDVQEDVQKENVDRRLAGIKDMRKKVKRALSRLKSGNYGICEKCGNQISKERLEAFPETTVCKECASKN